MRVSTSPKRVSMSFSFWKVIVSMLLAFLSQDVRNPGPGGFALERRGWSSPLRLGRGFLLLPVLAREALHAAGRVDQLLLAGEERMAARADLQAQLLAL